MGDDHIGIVRARKACMRWKLNSRTHALRKLMTQPLDDLRFDISLVVLGLVICKNSSTLVVLFYEEPQCGFGGAWFKYGSACPLWSNNSNLQRIHKITRNIYREAHCFKGGWRLEGQVKWSVFLVTLKWRFNMDGILWEGKIGSLSLDLSGSSR